MPGDVAEGHRQPAVRETQCVVPIAAHVGAHLTSRWDGDQLLVALADGDERAALELLDQLRRRWVPPVAATTFSAGVAVLEPGEMASSVVTRAERALAAAKALGGDRTAADKTRSPHPCPVEHPG